MSFPQEAAKKYNNRHLSDADRMVKLIRCSDQRRLTYNEQVSDSFMSQMAKHQRRRGGNRFA